MYLFNLIKNEPVKFYKLKFNCLKMQNVRFQASHTERIQFRPYQSNNEYCKPLAAKQHAGRIKRIVSNRTDESDKTSKASSTYCSNIDRTDDISQFEDKQFFNDEVEVDELMLRQQELIELQMSVQKSLQLIQKKINQTTSKPNKSIAQNCKRERKNSFNSTAYNANKNNNVKNSLISKKYDVQHATPHKLVYEPNEKLYRSKSGLGLTESK